MHVFNRRKEKKKNEGVKKGEIPSAILDSVFTRSPNGKRKTKKDK